MSQESSMENLNVCLFWLGRLHSIVVKTAFFTVHLRVLETSHLSALLLKDEKTVLKKNVLQCRYVWMYYLLKSYDCTKFSNSHCLMFKDSLTCRSVSEFALLPGDLPEKQVITTKMWRLWVCVCSKP